MWVFVGLVISLCIRGLAVTYVWCTHTYIPVVGNEETGACAGKHVNEIVTKCWND